MKKETLLRALTAVRDKIATADRKAADWLAERDRRRRQEAAFLRGIIRVEGSQRKAALATGISARTIARTLDPQGHERERMDKVECRRGAATFQNVAAPEPGNVVPLRLQDWYPNDLGWIMDNRNIKTIENALERCSKAELAYVIYKLVPVFKKALRNKIEKDLKRRKDNDTTADAKEDRPAHGAG